VIKAEFSASLLQSAVSLMLNYFLMNRSSMYSM